MSMNAGCVQVCLSVGRPTMPGHSNTSNGILTWQQPTVDVSSQQKVGIVYYQRTEVPHVGQGAPQSSWPLWPILTDMAADLQHQPVAAAAQRGAL